MSLTQVYQINLVEKAKHCGELYFQRQCFHPTTYVTSQFNFRVECSLSREPALNSNGDKWDQTSEKFGLQALMFNHPLDLASPGTGIRVKVQSHVSPSLLSKYLTHRFGGFTLFAFF